MRESHSAGEDCVWKQLGGVASGMSLYQESSLASWWDRCELFLWDIWEEMTWNGPEQTHWWQKEQMLPDGWAVLFPEHASLGWPRPFFLHQKCLCSIWPPCDSVWLILIRFKQLVFKPVMSRVLNYQKGRQMRRRGSLLPSSSWHLVGETHAPSVGKEVTEGQTKWGASEVCLWWVEREVKQASWRRHLMVQSHDQDKDKIMAWENLLSKYLPLPLHPLQQASACLVNLDSLFLVKGTLLSSWACGSLKYETIFSSFHGS